MDTSMEAILVVTEMGSAHSGFFLSRVHDGVVFATPFNCFHSVSHSAWNLI